MALIRAPIIVISGSDVDLFESIEAASSYMEPIDVENNEYSAAYDSSGNVLEIGIDWKEQDWSFLWFSGTAENEVVTIKLRIPVENKAEELRQAILKYLNYLSKHGKRKEIEYYQDLSLEDLLLCIKPR